MLALLFYLFPLAWTFQSPSALRQATVLSSSSNDDNLPTRRELLWTAAAATTAGIVSTTSSPAQASVFLDPAMYGDQELRVSAVDTVRESVRRSILQNPALAPAFYQLALIDALSYVPKSQSFGPDGWSVFVAAASKSSPLQPAAQVILDTVARMKQKNAVTVADALAIAGAQSIESIGGPVLPVQLGRTDHAAGQPLPAQPALNLLSGDVSKATVVEAFRAAGMTDREMTALVAGLMTLTAAQKNRTPEDMKETMRPKFREAGKIGRMSEFRALTDEDIADAELRAEFGNDEDDWYIADSFGTRADRFGKRLAKDDMTEQTFNKYLQQLNSQKKGATEELGWTADLLLDADLSPTTASLLNKYSTANLAFTKDLKVAYNAITQLGAVYTGGKYESLLKNKPRKSLNDDGLNLF